MVKSLENRLSLDMLTLFGMPPVEHVKLAADLGCAAVSVGLSNLNLAQFGYGDFQPYPEWSLLHDLNMRRELKAALRDTGMKISLGEAFRVLPETDVREQIEALDIMAELGAAYINGGSMDPDMARTHQQLSILADLVIERGMQLSLEFAPSNVLKTLEHGLDAISQIGADRCSLLVDAMHLFRSGSTIEGFESLDPSLIGYAQLCDVPINPQADSYIGEAMFARMIPGMGELPLRQWISALPSDIWIGLEVPMIEELRGGTIARDYAARVVAAARELGV